MQGTFAAGMKDGKMRVVLAPGEDTAFGGIKTKEAAIKKIKERKKSKKSVMVRDGIFTEKALQEWVEESQARGYYQ